MLFTKVRKLRLSVDIETTSAWDKANWCAFSWNEFSSAESELVAARSSNSVMEH